MPFSKRCQHGLKAAVQLAIRHQEGYIQAGELAKVESLPAKFLEAVLLQMRLAGLLESKVGAGGGYRLTRHPQAIPVQELLDVFETEPVPSDGGDTPDTPGAHAVGLLMNKLSEAARSALSELTLDDLVQMVDDRRDQPMFHI